MYGEVSPGSTVEVSSNHIHTFLKHRPYGKEELFANTPLLGVDVADVQ